MRTSSTTLTAAVVALLATACSQDSTAPSEPAAVPPATLRVKAQDAGPEHLAAPKFNLDVVLRGQGRGFLRFRQPNDGAKIVNLGIRVRHLAAHTNYLLQRAVDPIVDGDCTSADWLTLGKGLTPQAITTSGRGRGYEKLFRDLSAVPDRTPFDIHFRVIDAVTSVVVLESGCYRFRVKPR